MERETDEEADARREAAIASSASLRPNFKLKNGLTQAHLAKFQELHSRRLKIKAKSKVYKRDKGDGKGKSNKKAVEAHESEPSKAVGEAATDPISENKVTDVSSGEADRFAAEKRQKLHWGLDAKERWERKSNM